jgi:hypothetical protein
MTIKNSLSLSLSLSLSFSRFASVHPAPRDHRSGILLADTPKIRWDVPFPRHSDLSSVPSEEIPIPRRQLAPGSIFDTRERGEKIGLIVAITVGQYR